MIAQTGNRTNTHYEWATTHNQPHFALEADAPAAYAEFQAAFAHDVPSLDAGALIQACQRPSGSATQEPDGSSG